MTQEALPFSPAAERNAEPILTVLRRWLPPGSARNPLRLLELGSGSGQHAVHMTRQIPWLLWQPSELPAALAGLARRVALEGREGLAPGSRILVPLALDVGDRRWPAGPFGAVFSANTLHIMPAAAIPALLAGAAGVLAEGGLLLLYGPFRYGSEHTAASNAAFDEQLRGFDPAMGVRDALALRRQAAKLGLEPAGDEPMPANNRLLVFRRQTRPGR
jgi:SAM-dependent methyltransferase